MFVALQIAQQANSAREQAIREGRDPDEAAREATEAGTENLRHCLGVITKGMTAGVMGGGSVLGVLLSVGRAVARDLKKS